MNIEQQIADYKPYNEQEAHDQAVMRQLLATQPDLFTRENEVAHMTASSWLLNATHDKVLMIYHNIYHSWAWTAVMRTETETFWRLRSARRWRRPA